MPRKQDVPDGPFEVMVDTWGHQMELSKGDIVDAADLDDYDVAWALRQNVIRPLSAGEARLLAERPMESTTQPLTPSGEIDQSVQEAAGGGPDVLMSADLTDEQRANLRAAGYDSAAALDAASDEQLLDVQGVGPAAVKRLRDARAG